MEFYAKIVDETIHTVVYQIAYMDTLAEMGIHVRATTAPDCNGKTYNFKWGKKEDGWLTYQETQYLIKNFDVFCENLKEIYKVYAEDKEFLSILKKQFR